MLDNNFFEEVSCEEVFTEASKYIFCTADQLPPAMYMGNNEWVDAKGNHYIVM